MIVTICNVIKQARCVVSRDLVTRMTMDGLHFILQRLERFYLPRGASVFQLLGERNRARVRAVCRIPFQRGTARKALWSRHHRLMMTLLKSSSDSNLFDKNQASYKINFMRTT